MTPHSANEETYSLNKCFRDQRHKNIAGCRKKERETERGAAFIEKIKRRKH